MKRFIAIVLLILVMLAFAYIMYARVMGYGTTSPDDWDTRPGVSVNGNTYVCAGHVRLLSIWIKGMPYKMNLRKTV